VAKVVDSSQVQIAIFKKKLSPLFELTFVLVRFDHIALGIVNANHSIMRPAVEFYVADCIPDCVWAAIPQWAVWEHVAD
jgi:hypothetical protein